MVMLEPLLRDTALGAALTQAQLEAVGSFYCTDDHAPSTPFCCFLLPYYSSYFKEECEAKPSSRVHLAADGWYLIAIVPKVKYADIDSRKRGFPVWF